MTLTFELEPELHSSLRAVAQAEGVSVEQYVQRLIVQVVERRRAGKTALRLLQDWESEDATEDQEELARRERDWETFCEGLNRSHSSDRVLLEITRGHDKLERLPALVASFPRLSEAEAKEFADDLERAREELSRSDPADPCHRSGSVDT